MLNMVRASSDQIWMSYLIFKQVNLWLTSADPCVTFDPGSVVHFAQGVLRTKFGSHVVFFQKIDLNMTFELW